MPGFLFDAVASAITDRGSIWKFFAIIAVLAVIAFTVIALAAAS